MAHLTLAGLSDDGRRLLLVDDQGGEFTLDVDARLRAALRGDHARLGQLEITMESALRPRDIQTRIRAGETPEQVAQAAQTSVDRIMVYAAPVLAERQHVADRAQRSSVRRRGGEAGPAAGGRTLGEVVDFHLRSHNVDPGTVAWDAWRREDGRWTLTGEFTTPTRTGTATFAFDAPGNFVLAEDDDARWLLGEQAAGAVPPPARDDLSQARERRLTAVPAEELPLGDDALGLLAEPEQPIEAFLDDEPTREQPAVEAPPVDPPAERPPAATAPEPAEAPEEPEPQRRTGRKKGRASVPSWDEIMFGGGKGE